MSLKKFAIEEKSVLHLRDASEELMYADGTDGTPDQTKPMRVCLYGPGSKVYARALASASNRRMDIIKKRGKVDQSAEEKARELAEYLASCTHSMENVEYEGLAGQEMFKAIYSDLSLIFIPQQIEKFIGDTANFTKASATS